MQLCITLLALFTSFVVSSVLGDKIYGVNLGNWLVFEPWMAEQEWQGMGGEKCSNCTQCIRSEWALNKAHPNSAQASFQKHWETWFTQTDVDNLVSVGINTVRVPLGFWIIEPLGDRSTEFYARGGLTQLKRGLRMLNNAGIRVLLEHHVLPGVSSSVQMFAGKCTTDIEFYTPHNYQRALVWSAVMTTLIHLDPDYRTVYALQAINEPERDAAQTPGLQQFYTDFVYTVRGVELAVGINTPGFNATAPHLSNSNNNLNHTLPILYGDTRLSLQVRRALQSALQILIQLEQMEGYDFVWNYGKSKDKPIETNFMDYNWQFNDQPNAAKSVLGPASYDDHLYYSFGGVASPNEDAYLKSMCDLGRLATDNGHHNIPLFYGEWSLTTQFNATDSFLRKWADAQKFTYGKAEGWFFLNFKFEKSKLEGDMFPREWDYIEGVRRGYLTHDPSQLHDEHVCAPYLNT